MYKLNPEAILIGAWALAWPVAIMGCIAACAGLSAPDPATAAREARKASIQACAAYETAVSLRPSLRDDATEKVCASVRAVCDESPAP